MSNPYGPNSHNPYPNTSNPYSAPQITAPTGYSSGNGGMSTGPRNVDFGEIFNYAFEIWKNNLGLLISVLLIQIVVSLVFWGAEQGIIFAMEQQNQELLGLLLSMATSFVGNAVDIFLGIGMVQINLRLARGEQAELGDMFGGGSVFLPVLGMSILVGIVTGVGYMACILPGVFLTLILWPFYYFITDQKSTAFGSIEAAYSITWPNLLTNFVMLLVSIALFIVGFLALFVGVLFSAPLVAMIYAVGYLMMSGQLVPSQKMYK